MPSRQERIDSLIEQATELIEEVAREGRKDVEEAERTADENVERYQALEGEKRSLKGEAERLGIEREKLPVEHSKALLEDDVDTELRIKDRYTDIKERLDEISARLPEIERELKFIEGPNPVHHELEVSIRQYRRVNRAASEPRAALARIGNTIVAEADKALGYFDRVIEDRMAESEGWRNEVAWSPEARERLRASGNSVREEDRTQIIRKDEESLARHASGADQPPSPV